jgi:uncharacterized protein YdaT
MPWTMSDYPSSMKNLNNTTKKKAIDIANSMIDEGYKEGQAIPIAIEQAKEWYENTDKAEAEHYKQHGKPTTRSAEGKKYSSNPERLEEGEEVVSHEDGWAVKSSNAKRASNIFDTKEEAIERAKEIAENKQTSITVYKQDGSVQYHKSYEA